MSAKFIRFSIISFLLALSAAGCGQKGPLFLPEDGTRPAEQPATTEASATEEVEADQAVDDE